MSLYEAVKDLPLEIDDYVLEGLELQARADFLRKTTVVHLQGALAALSEEAFAPVVGSPVLSGAEHAVRRMREDGRLQMAQEMEALVHLEPDGKKASLFGGSKGTGHHPGEAARCERLEAALQEVDRWRPGRRQGCQVGDVAVAPPGTGPGPFPAPLQDLGGDCGHSSINRTGAGGFEPGHSA